MPGNPIGRALRHRRAGEHTLLWARPELQRVESFTLTSPAFAHGAPIPAHYRGRIFGPNLSPPLAWTPAPAGAIELLLVVQDRDVPSGKPATHALACGIDPEPRGLPEDALANPSPVAGLRHGKGVFGRRSWTGPMPIRSHGPHTYAFQIFALDRPSDLREGFTLAAALGAMAGHVIGRARVDGTYENP